MQHMIIFTKAPQSVIGPGAAIKYPHGWSELVDYEAELAVIIGKPGHGIRKEDALDHIFGGSWAKAVTHSVQWDPG
jgi:2-keto-4-pentenoate hydratase/2-oxohepta-3-ene-1,7-dioic acid hydratase in catechol pathway